MAVIEVSTQVQSAPQAPPEPAPTLGPPMGSVIWLSALVALLALFATVVGVFS